MPSSRIPTFFRPQPFQSRDRHLVRPKIRTIGTRKAFDSSPFPLTQASKDRFMIDFQDRTSLFAYIPILHTAESPVSIAQSFLTSLLAGRRTRETRICRSHATQEKITVIELQTLKAFQSYRLSSFHARGKRVLRRLLPWSPHTKLSPELSHTSQSH